MLKFETKKHPAKIYRRVTKLCTLLDHTMYPYNPHQHIQKSIFFNFQPALTSQQGALGIQYFNCTLSVVHDFSLAMYNTKVL